MGIVSAKGRSGMHILDYEDFIQTDAAINPGNSGGALINMRGELVGINTAILSRSGGSQGIGFAIPTDMARPIMDSLLKHGSVKRGWLGVGIQDLSPQLAETFGTSARQGVLLSEVRPDTPAARSGLRRGDLVLKAAGREVRKADELRNLVAAQAPGSVLPLEIEREGKRLQLGVTLGSRPAEGPPGAGGTPAESSELASQGLSVADLDATARQRFQVPREVRGGVMITGVAPGSPAEQAGLRPGDVIIEVNRRPVTSVREFDAARRSTPTLLLVVREGGTFYVPLRR
jgi:serine protease Do